MNDSDKILFLAEQEIDSPIVNLGVDMENLDFLGIVNDLPDVLDNPIVKTLLIAHGAPAALSSWLTLYGRAAEEAEILINTLIYPNTGQLAFDAK